ncbi:MAG: hypothetical protein J0L92_27720 [Deltaproteobacteria bacterium]|nr:hypothetical protein [Deltaproteobacteria bacterium]
MSFGKNPHVAKAQLAEQKAELANDHLARDRAYREAAHLWERAASREQPGKRRTEYEAHAERIRAIADGETPSDTQEEPRRANEPVATAAFLN